MNDKDLGRPIISTFALDDRGLFCQHCGRAHWLHFYQRGVGFACFPATPPVSKDHP